MGRITAYLNELKVKSGYTQQQLAEITDIPSGTIPRYFSNIDDSSASFETVRKLVMAMGGSLDELAGIVPKQLEINQEQLTKDGFTEAETKAILRWAGNEISRSYQSIVAGLEARLAEKDERLSHRSGMVEAEHRRADEEITYERRRAHLATVISYITLGLFVLLFFCDFLLPTTGWIHK